MGAIRNLPPAKNAGSERSEVTGPGEIVVHHLFSTLVDEHRHIDLAKACHLTAPEPSGPSFPESREPSVVFLSGTISGPVHESFDRTCRCGTSLMCGIWPESYTRLPLNKTSSFARVFTKPTNTNKRVVEVHRPPKPAKLGWTLAALS